MGQSSLGLRATGFGPWGAACCVAVRARVRGTRGRGLIATLQAAIRLKCDLRRNFCSTQPSNHRSDGNPSSAVASAFPHLAVFRFWQLATSGCQLLDGNPVSENSHMKPSISVAPVMLGVRVANAQQLVTFPASSVVVPLNCNESGNPGLSIVGSLIMFT